MAAAGPVNSAADRDGSVAAVVVVEVPLRGAAVTAPKARSGSSVRYWNRTEEEEAAVVALQIHKRGGEGGVGE